MAAGGRKAGIYCVNIAPALFVLSGISAQILNCFCLTATLEHIAFVHCFNKVKKVIRIRRDFKNHLTFLLLENSIKIPTLLVSS